MKSNEKRCVAWTLYVITSPQKGRRLEDVVAEAVRGGASVIQLRDKTASHGDLVSAAKRLISVTRPRKVPLIVNDDVKAAFESGADGVHLGQEDGDLQSARSLLGPNAIIGRSTHSTEQALNAEREGFDYIGVGPVFSTPTKPGRPAVGLEMIRFAAKELKVPFVAIGGIDPANIGEVIKAGARIVAVVRAIMEAENPCQLTQRLNEAVITGRGKALL